MTTPCRADSGADPDTWFRETTADQAKQICATCPVFDACRAVIDRLEADGRHEFGIWAGEDPYERQDRRGQTPHRFPRPRLARTHHQACTECGRPFRPRHIPAADAPGTVIHSSHGLCQRCAGRARKEDQQ